jgi:hypothetical protein
VVMGWCVWWWCGGAAAVATETSTSTPVGRCCERNHIVDYIIYYPCCNASYSYFFSVHGSMLWISYCWIDACCTGYDIYHY